MTPTDPDSPVLEVGPAPEGELLVSVDRLVKFFPLHRSWPDAVLHPLQEERVAVVKGASFEVRAGEVFGLLGPNGAGKSTLLRMLSTELVPDGGNATVGGFDLVRQRNEVRRLVASIDGGENDLYPGLSARENMRRFSGAGGAATGARPERPERPDEGRASGVATTPHRIDEALALAGLTEVSDRPVENFSSAMKQRLLVARMLLSRPSILLMDEPLRTLDPSAAMRFRSFLRNELAPQGQCTVIFASQDPEEAFEVCDRVAIMDRGEVRAVGTPKRFLDAIGDEWYRLWMRQTGLDSLMTLTGHRNVHGFRSHAASQDGWAQVEVEIPGGLETAAHVLSSLTKSGIHIARFERVGLSLSQILDRLSPSPGMLDSSAGESPGRSGGRSGPGNGSRDTPPLIL